MHPATLALLLTAATPGAVPGAAHPVQAALVADASVVPPGGTLRLGALLRIQPGWHVYWKAPGDAGSATRITWDLPAGWSAGPLAWPLPERLEEPGDLVVHGYHEALLLAAPVQVPADAPGGAGMTVSARVRWLVCEKACIPGEASLEGRIRVGDRRVPMNRPLFDAWQARLPVAPGAPGTALAAARVAGRLGAPGTTTRLGLDLTWAGAPARDLEFFPVPADNLEVRLDPVAAGDARIDFVAEVLAGPVPPPRHLPLLVTYRGPGGARQGVELELPLTGTVAP